MRDVEGAFERFRDLIPEGAIPIAVAGTIEYLDRDGRNGYLVIHNGDVALSTYVGLLELAKGSLIDHARDEWDRDND